MLHWNKNQVIGREKFNVKWVVDALKAGLPISYVYLIRTNFDLVLNDWNKYYGAREGEFDPNYSGTIITNINEFERAFAQGLSTIEILEVCIMGDAFVTEQKFLTKNNIKDDPEYFNNHNGGSKHSKGITDFDHTNELKQLTRDKKFPIEEWTWREVLMQYKDEDENSDRKKIFRFQGRTKPVENLQRKQLYNRIVDSAGNSIKEANEYEPIVFWKDYNGDERKYERGSYTAMDSNHVLDCIDEILIAHPGFIDLDSPCKVQILIPKVTRRAEKHRQMYSNGLNAHPKFPKTPSSDECLANTLIENHRLAGKLGKEPINSKSYQVLAYLREQNLSQQAITAIVNKANDMIATNAVCGDDKLIVPWPAEKKKKYSGELGDIKIKLRDKIEDKGRIEALNNNYPTLVMIFGSNKNIDRRIMYMLTQYFMAWDLGKATKEYNESLEFIIHKDPMKEIKKIVICVVQSSEKDRKAWRAQEPKIDNYLNYWTKDKKNWPVIEFYPMPYWYSKGDNTSIDKLTLDF